MSAKTRQNNISVISRLAALYSAAVSLISNDNRSKKSVSLLLDALQFFKEDRLGAVWSGDSPQMQYRQQQQRIALGHQLQSKYAVQVQRGVDLAECCSMAIFRFSRTIGASLFIGAFGGSFRKMFKTPKSCFLDTPQAQEVVREVEEKIRPYGLYLGMSDAELNEAFGPPPEPGSRSSE